MKYIWEIKSRIPSNKYLRVDFSVFEGRNVQMILETTYGCQTKLIGQSLCVSEQRIGYLNLVFATNQGQKRLTFSFKPLKLLEELEIQS